MRAINDQPSWTRKDGSEQEGSILLVNTLLLGAMQQTLLAIHRSYLDDNEGRASLSQSICQSISRDVLHSMTALKDTGLTGMMLLRGDILLASLNLIRISLLQAERKLSPSTSSQATPAFKVLMLTILTGPGNFGKSNSQITIELLEDCLPLKDETLPRRALGGHWDLMTMCAGIMLLKIDLGLETRETAKSTIARRFLDAYYRFFGRQDANNARRQCYNPDSGQRYIQRSKWKLQTQDMASVLTGSQLLNVNNPEVSKVLNMRDDL
jgi:hypothetical protein